MKNRRQTWVDSEGTISRTCWLPEGFLSDLQVRAFPNAPGPWTQLNTEYQGRFGISPEEATPPPVRD